MDYATKTPLILPFHGMLMVSNGGRSPETNTHMKFEGTDGPKNQLYAYDFRLGHIGSGTKLEEYEAFGREVIAPGDGIIIQVVSGAIDVLPGERDRGIGVGNMVIIDHQNGEYSLLCHFRHESIRVAVGDVVRQGTILGLCGNTGNTSEPHIHYNLQDAPRMHIAGALPAQFEHIIVDGKPADHCEPVRGQYVSNV